MTYGQMLRLAMGDMTQAELSDRSGLRQATISRLVNDERRPSYGSQLALERVLPGLRDLRDKAAA